MKALHLERKNQQFDESSPTPEGEQKKTMEINVFLGNVAAIS